MLPIVLTTVAVPLMLTESAQGTWILIGATVATGLTVGAIGWLLFDRAESGAERVVFVLGAMALAGGAAAYLRVSPLAVGLDCRHGLGHGARVWPTAWSSKIWDGCSIRWSFCCC